MKNPRPATASPAENLRSIAGASGRRWRAQLAKLFVVTLPAKFTSPDAPLLKPVTGKNFRRTWVASSSLASVSLSLKNGKYVILIVLGAGFRLEEHYVSDLHFWWPRQVARLFALAKYRDHENQVHKFALKFSDVSEACSFSLALKECSQECKDGSTGFLEGCSSSQISPLHSDNLDPSDAYLVDADRVHMPQPEDRPSVGTSFADTITNVSDDEEDILEEFHRLCRDHPPAFEALYKKYCTAPPAGL